jgi:hypothetical protein
MIDSVIAPTVKADIKLIPTLSQTFLVSLIVFALVLMVCSAFLLRDESPAGWAFFAAGVLVTVGAGFGWWKSQADVDSAGAHPTIVTRPDGGSLTTDLRTIRSPQALQNLAQLANGILNTQPLPIADGLVDSNLTLIPNSKEKAEAVTLQINEVTQAVTNGLVDVFKLAEDSATVAPVLLDTIKE